MLVTFSSFLTARFYDDQDQLMTGNTTGAAELWDINTGRRLGRWHLVDRVVTAHAPEIPRESETRAKRASRETVEDLQAWDHNDPYLMQGTQKYSRLKFGFGAHYKADRWFAGLSIPTLLAMGC